MDEPSTSAPPLSVWKKGGSTLPVDCFHSPREGGRTSSASGMFVDTHSPDHVMAPSPRSPQVTFKVNDVYLVGQQNEDGSEMSPEIEFWTAWD